MGPEFPDICLIVEVNSRKNLNQEIDPTGDRTRPRWVRGNDVTPRSKFWSPFIELYRVINHISPPIFIEMKI